MIVAVLFLSISVGIYLWFVVKIASLNCILGRPGDFDAFHISNSNVECERCVFIVLPFCGHVRIGSRVSMLCWILLYFIYLKKNFFATHPEGLQH